jgi:chemotaxis signal transduction protein
MSYESMMNADVESMTEVQRQILDVSDADVQVLTFTIAGDKYCIDIDPVSEVLWNEHDVASMPNLPEHVLGISNLRDRSVQIVDPKILLEEPSEGEEENIILFEAHEDAEADSAWLVDSVEQVLRVSNDEIDESVADEQIEGIIERDDELIMWVSSDCFNVDLREIRTDTAGEVSIDPET